MRVIVAVLALIIASCSYSIVAESETTMQRGDLIFTVADQGDMSQAIAAATRLHPDSLTFDHVAIYLGDNAIIEAAPRCGVAITALDTFLIYNPSIIVKRLDPATPVDINTAIERARSFIGHPYDWAYSPDAEAIYCSELIYLSYLDGTGMPVFEAKPMNFANPDGTFPQFWIDLFEKLRCPIPQGIPGTNPTALARSPLLHSVTSMGMCQK